MYGQKINIHLSFKLKRIKISEMNNLKTWLSNTDLHVYLK